MGNPTYYPAQKITAGGTEINFAQSANVDFSISRQLIYEFGNLFPVDNVQVEPAAVKFDFSYVLAAGENNATTLGLNNFGTLLGDVVGKTYTLVGAGVLTVLKGVITSYSVEGSVGNVPIASVSVLAQDATYNASNPTMPAGSVESNAEIIRPDQITISLGGAYSCKSFSFTVDIPREYINELGSLEPVGIFVSGPPKVTIEAEIYLKDSKNPLFDPNEKIAVSIACGSYTYSVSNAAILNFTANASLDAVQSASITLEAPILSAGDISIE